MSVDLIRYCEISVGVVLSQTIMYYNQSAFIDSASASIIYNHINVNYASTEILRIFPFSHKPVRQAVLPHCIWWMKSISTQLNLSHFHLLPHL